MSIVIIGGNECMECHYKEICKRYGYEAKVRRRSGSKTKRHSHCPQSFKQYECFE